MNIFTRNSSVFLPSKLTNLGMFPSLKNVFVKLIFFLLFIQVSEQVHLPFLLTLFRMDFFGAAHGWGGKGAFWPPLPKIPHTYPTMMKLGTVIPYLRKMQKMYKSRDTFLDFC